MSPKKKPASNETARNEVPPPRSRRRLLMTKADWERVADANARAEREPDPEQITMEIP